MNLPKESHLYALYNKDPKVVVDVGANVGVFSVEVLLAFQPPCQSWRGALQWTEHATSQWRKQKWLPFTLGFEFGHSSLALYAFEPKRQNFELLNATLRSFCHGRRARSTSGSSSAA
eukprot:RCo008252